MARSNSANAPVNRLRQQLVDEVTREPVDNADKGRGYEYSKNAYVLVDDEELDAIAIESTHTIEIDTFVPREQIDERYLDSPYYITPNDQVGQDAFAVRSRNCPGRKPRREIKRSPSLHQGF